MAFHFYAGIAHDDPSGGHIGQDFRTATRNHTIANKDIVHHAGLAAQHHVVADLDRARNPRLPAQQTIAPDPGVVPNMHEVIQFRAVADHRVADRAVIDCTVGTNLDIVADLHRTQ